MRWITFVRLQMHNAVNCFILKCFFKCIFVADAIRFHNAPHSSNFVDSCLILFDLGLQASRCSSQWTAQRKRRCSHRCIVQVSDVQAAT